jgi:ABC-2 type transport system permease protein
MSEVAPKSRLSLLAAAWVIARRDFTAVLFSRAFFFFLLGPLFPIIVGGLAGGIGNALDKTAGQPEIGIAMTSADANAMLQGRAELQPALGRSLPNLRVLKRLEAGEKFDARAYLERKQGNVAAVITGSPFGPVLTAPEGLLNAFSGDVALIAAAALKQTPSFYPTVTPVKVASSGASQKHARLVTAQAGQTLLFLLIMLLAGMVLSNLVEEKANKIIEILAAAIPMDAVFMGKLFAMLGVSLVGIAIWSAVIGSLVELSHGSGALAHYFPSGLPNPGVGWPMFVLLGIAYFAMGYLLLGSIFLAIGSLATTVREVQTLSMPVTMAQILLFFFASYAMAHQGDAIEIAAMAFPLSSPFAMLARAAQAPELWPHLVAIVWQAVWVAIAVRIGANLFRRRVMKSGPQPAKRKRRLPGRGGAEVARAGAGGL